MFVRDWMSAPVFVAPPDMLAEEALAYMERRKVRRLPVVLKNRLAGIVTKSDLLAEFGRHRPSSPATTWQLSDVMTRNPLSVGPDDTIETAAQIMLQKKISGLPVVKDDRVVGILTESDLFRALCDMLGIGEPGARLVMTVKDGDDVLGSIGRRLNGLTLRSLVTVHDSRRGRWVAVLRVRGRTAVRAQA
jgi:acetoin utilization protein AcuB